MTLSILINSIYSGRGWINSKYMDAFFEPMIDAIMAIVSILLILFIPGYPWTTVLFPKNGEFNFRPIDRLLISFIISITSVTTLAIGLNVFIGVRLDLPGVFLSVSIVTILGIVFYLLRKSGIFNRPSKNFGEGHE